MDNILKKINTEVFASNTCIAAAFLFGSHASDTANSQSDVDIALITDKDLSPEEEFKLKLEIQAKLVTIGIDNADLVILNNATPVLRHAASYRNKVLFCRPDFDIPSFIVATRKVYEDMLYYYQPHIQAQKERFANDTKNSTK
jgi:uncharacterized protein